MRLAIAGAGPYCAGMRYCLLFFLLLLQGGIMVPAALAARVSLAIVTTPGSAQHVTATAFKELAANATNGELDVTIHHSASLGDETAILQQVRMGAVQLAVITGGPLDAFAPEVAVVSYPYLFDSYAEVDAVLDGPLGREILDRLEPAGFKGLAFAENGFRHLTTAKRPVQTVEDVKDLKIRVMRSSMHHTLWRMLGANPTPMGWPIYTELAQGAIDGQENPLWVVAVAKLFEVQSHLSLTRHVYSAHVCLANLQWFNGLDAATREAVATAMQQAAQQERAWARENEAGHLEMLQAEGMQVVTPDLASFKAKAAGMRQADIYQQPAVQDLLHRLQAATAD